MDKTDELTYFTPVVARNKFIRIGNFLLPHNLLTWDSKAEKSAKPSEAAAAPNGSSLGSAMAGPALGGGGLLGGGGRLGGPPFPFGGRAGVGESFSPGRGARAGGPSNTGDSLWEREKLSRIEIEF